MIGGTNMKRSDIKNILMALRNNSNESIINNLLGKIDLLPEEKLQHMIAQVGDENNIKQFFLQKIEELHNKHKTSLCYYSNAKK